MVEQQGYNFAAEMAAILRAEQERPETQTEGSGSPRHGVLPSLRSVPGCFTQLTGESGYEAWVAQKTLGEAAAHD